MLPPAVLAWGTFRKVTVIAPQVASETNKVKGEELMSGRDNIRSTPSTSLPHLCGKTKRVKDSACVSKRQTKSDQKKKKGFWCKVCLHPHLKQRETPLVKTKKMALVAFFLSYR